MCQFRIQLQVKLAHKGPYQASVGRMWLRLLTLQAEDQEARRIGEQSQKDGWEEGIDGLLQHQGLPNVPEVIREELISRHHDDPLAGHFGIDKTRELIARKYSWPNL